MGVLETTLGELRFGRLELCVGEGAFARALIAWRTKAPALPEPGRDCRLTALQEGPDLVLVACRQEMATSAGKYLDDDYIEYTICLRRVPDGLAPVAADARCSFI